MVEVAVEDEVWCLKWLISSSPLVNLFPQKSPPLIQLHMKGGWESWFAGGINDGIPVDGNEGIVPGVYG